MNKTIIIRILFFHGKYLVEENNVDYLHLSTDSTKPLRKKKPFLFVLVSCRAFKFKIRSPTTQVTVTYVFTIKIIIFVSIIKPDNP